MLNVEYIPELETTINIGRALLTEEEKLRQCLIRQNKIVDLYISFNQDPRCVTHGLPIPEVHSFWEARDKCAQVTSVPTSDSVAILPF